MNSSRSFQLAASFALLVSSLIGQAPGHDRSEVPKIIFGPDAKPASLYAIQPPDAWRTHCTNRADSYGRPMSVAELVSQGGHLVRDIRVKRYFSADRPANVEAIRGVLLRVWQGKFDSAECFQDWDEMTLWSYSALVEFYADTPAELITDGSHVYVKDHDGKTWFLRLPE